MPVIPVPGLPPMPPGADGWCGWDVDPAIQCAAWADYPVAIQDAALSIATTVLWAATGRRYGACELTVRPCQNRERAEAYRAYPVWWTTAEFGGPYPFLFAGQWANCGCGTQCCCRARCEIVLDGPVTSVVEVLVDGVAVPADEYRVDVAEGAYHLVKTSSGCWPTCQDFNVNGDEVGAFQITYTRGRPTPPSALFAAGLLACTIAKQLSGADCGLPPRMSSLSRQGVTADFIVESIDVDTFTTGIQQVDMVIRALNPSRRTRPPAILSPDMPAGRDRITIIGAP